MSKTKKVLLSVIIVEIITILALTTALAIILPLKKDNSKQNNLEVQAYTFNEEIDPNEIEHRTKFQEIYDNTTVFEIGSPEAFKRFTYTVYYLHIFYGHKGHIIKSVRFDNNYSGKLVKLTSNINLSDVKINSHGCESFIKNFSGTFDGQGHTISNFSSSNFSSESVSLFTTVSGTIKNVRFLNCHAYIPSSMSGDTCAGIIASTLSQGGVIECCIVDSPSFQSSRFKTNCYVAPIAGDNSGTVKNCIVTGTYKIGGENDNWPTNDDGLYASYFVCATNEAIHCIFVATVEETWVTTETIGPAENDKNAFDSGFSNYNSYWSAFSAWKGKYSYITDSWEGRYDQYSEVGGPFEIENKVWFAYNEGNANIPIFYGYGKNGSIPIYLRAFVDFTEYTVTAGEGGYVKNSLTGATTNQPAKQVSMWLPNEYLGVEYRNYGYVDAVNYAGVGLTAYADQYYTFDRWDNINNTNNTATATFKRNKIIIQFASVTLGETSISGSNEIVVDYLDGNPLADPVYNKTDNTLTYTYYVNRTPTTFVYTFTSKNNWTVDVISGSAYVWDGTAKLTITPTFKLKEYGSVWL